ncbi:MAG TPA: NAD(P)/FAD-dependent oxidoreductase [Chthoniobacterales bacterium]|jgi:FADH2-dependent halogenase|nr:NAD(P)/FAD-dependent oxidoreductase [Chthoniobacterales bacterium]
MKNGFGDIYDVAIIGGGPAGSTAATLLARAGRRVIVIEREKFPRFHIGESLLPFSTKTFDRLGVREKLDRTFLPKFGGEIVAACGSKGVKFYFKDGFRARRDRAYQVTRSEFDKLLLDHSRENGAEVREETNVKNITFDNDRAKIDIEMPAGARSTIEARYLLDCSGRQTMLGSFFKFKKMYDHLQKFSVFAHYENVDRAEGIDGTLIRMVRGLDRWFWMIPLTTTRMSIGVVLDTATFRAMKLSPEAALEKCIDEQPMVLERMKRAERVSPVYSAGDYSYRNAKLFGDRWLLAGDAAGFIDPVFSSGVFLAIMSAEKAADTLDEVLRDESRKRRLFKNYAHTVNHIMDIYLTFVNTWYRRGKEFIEVFLSPTDTMQIAAAVNALLAGNEGKSLAIKWRMWLFYFFVNAQRLFALSPRLTLVPKKEEPQVSPARIGAIS